MMERPPRYQDALDLRDRIADWWHRDEYARITVAAALAAGRERAAAEGQRDIPTKDVDDMAWRAADGLAHSTSTVATYYVSASVATALNVAADRFPAVPLAADEISDLAGGFVLWQQPHGRPTATYWGPLRTEDAAFVVIAYADAGGVIEPDRVTAAAIGNATEQDIDNKGGRGRGPLPLLRALWAFMAQELLVTEHERPDRAARKRYERTSMPEPSIRVVHLRRALRRPSETSGVGREWSCSWLVRGHWRRQWYPSQAHHAPRWIAPYPKGDPSKPLRGGERVFAVTR